MGQQYEWGRALDKGAKLAVENARKGAKLDERHVMWELLKEAAQVSQQSYKAPPRTGWPSKSSIPEPPPDVSQWHLIAAYLRGELDEMPADDTKPPLPSAEQVSRAEAVLWLWHHHALPQKGDKRRIKRGLYMKACGIPDRKIRALTGMHRQAIYRAKDEAMRDMWRAIQTQTLSAC